MENAVSLLKQFLDRLSPRQHNAYLISDTHFSEDDLRICCHRPFDDISEMDTTIADNWNATIKKDDTIYFLGDWGKNRWYWRKYLNGKKLSVKGNHDHGTRAPCTRILKTSNHKYLLVHDPYYGRHYHGWVIHGHHHNNFPKKYPFINGFNKTINVSAEVIGYKPVSLEAIEALDLSTIEWMQTAYSTPTRFTNL